MAAENHTPGPWLTYRPASGGYWIVTTNGARIGSAHLLQGRTVGAANANLMAAAPELLEALEGVLRVADRETDEFDAARAAIAKATGTA